MKTNQMKEVVDQVVKAGFKARYGLGRLKPELMIALSMNLHPEALISVTATRTRTSYMALLAVARAATLITVER